MNKIIALFIIFTIIVGSWGETCNIVTLEDKTQQIVCSLVNYDTNDKEFQEVMESFSSDFSGYYEQISNIKLDMSTNLISNLQYLNVLSNFKNLNKLTLYFSANQLSSLASLSSLSSLTNLQYLDIDISQNQLSALDGIEVISKFTLIKELHINIGSESNLNTIDILASNIPNSVENLSIDISSNTQIASYDQFFTSLSKDTILTELSIIFQNCQLTSDLYNQIMNGVGKSAFSNLQTLSLDFSGNQLFTDTSDISSLSQLSSLIDLSLIFPAYTSDSPGNLITLTPIIVETAKLTKLQNFSMTNIQNIYSTDDPKLSVDWTMTLSSLTQLQALELNLVIPCEQLPATSTCQSFFEDLMSYMVPLNQLQQLSMDLQLSGNSQNWDLTKMSNLKSLTKLKTFEFYIWQGIVSNIDLSFVNQLILLDNFLLAFDMSPDAATEIQLSSNSIKVIYLTINQDVYDPTQLITFQLNTPQLTSLNIEKSNNVAINLPNALSYLVTIYLNIQYFDCSTLDSGKIPNVQEFTLHTYEPSNYNKLVSLSKISTLITLNLYPQIYQDISFYKQFNYLLSLQTINGYSLNHNYIDVSEEYDFEVYTCNSQCDRCFGPNENQCSSCYSGVPTDNQCGKKDNPKKKHSHTLAIVLSSIGGVIVLGIAGFFVYRHLQKKGQEGSNQQLLQKVSQKNDCYSLQTGTPTQGQTNNPVLA